MVEWTPIPIYVLCTKVIIMFSTPQWILVGDNLSQMLKYKKYLTNEKQQNK